MGLGMRFSASMLALLALLSGCHKESQREKEIEMAQTAITNAIQEQDVTKLAALCSDDAVLVNLTSQETVEGKADIANYLKKQFEEFGKPTITTKVEKIDFPGEGKAVENGTMKLKFKPDSSLKIAYKAEFGKVNMGWVLQKWTQVDLLPPLSHYENLKDLDWMVGKWTNTADDLVFTCRYRWDENKNFLIQRFTLKVLGHKQLSGKQIIGWDPTKKRITSWVYDSEGGFGRINWTKSGNSWYQSALFTLSDGQRATATHIITKVDEKKYTFQSIGRDTDGRMMPNVGPFTVIKEG